MNGTGVGQEWWSLVTNDAAVPRAAELVIYDRIGPDLFSEGLTAKALLAELSSLDVDAIDVRLNSPGGSVWDGLAIHNALRAHPARVTTHIDGLAASIASVIALAGDEVRIAGNALMMIHDPFLHAEGNAAELRSAATMLERITDSLVAVYVGKTGATEVDVRAAMAAETWYSASDALAAGLVDVITGPLELAAEFDLSSFDNPPMREGSTMPDDPTTPPADDADARYASLDALAAVERQLQAVANLGGRGPERHALAAFDSFGDYALAVYRGDAEPVNVIADQTTVDNPGVMPPSWATEIKGIIGQNRPAVEAFGGATSAGSAGLELSWPYFAGDLAAIVAKQVAEKTDVHSVKVSFLKGSANLETYGAVSDVSYQLLMRSAPSYIDGMLRVYAAAYALTTDAAYAAALEAAAVPSGIYDYASDTDGKGLRSWAFGASVRVQRATGSPASAILVGEDVFVAVGGWDSFVPSKYGTNNVPGTAQASTLEVDVSGLPVVFDPNLAPDAIIASNRAATSWVEDGPHNATAEVPSKLGRDYAIFGFGAAAIYNAAGVVKPAAGP